MNVAGKCWGKTSLLFHRNNIELHRIEVIAGGYCSKHRHEHKYNAFYVETGDLQVSVWKNSYDLIDETDLREGDYMEVPPGEYHQFKSEGGCLAFEIYWVELDPGDIERAGVGGSDEGDEKRTEHKPQSQAIIKTDHHGLYDVSLGKWWDSDLNKWTDSMPITGERL